MTEVATHQPTALSFAEQWRYAEAVSSASMLPVNYRNKPADIMLAVGLGQSMGLSPAESLYRISVIQGKPAAGAELIAANVRKAGHKLRVQGDETSCTATIVRADDPDFEFSVTRDLAWAERMGLARNDNYKKQPGTMLQWRAITAVARLACPEALYGVTYTPDELTETSARVGKPEQQAVSVAAFTQPVEPAPAGEPTRVADPVTKAQQRRMHALFNEAGITDRDLRLAYTSDVIGRDVESSNDLTSAEASTLIDRLQNEQFGADEDPPADGDWPEPAPVGGDK